MNKVSAKGGRPRLPEHRKRTNDVRVRFNDMEYAIVKVKAAMAGREVSEYAREALLSALFKDFGVEVRNIGINLNRLAKAVNAGVPKDYAAEIRKALEDLSRIKDDFMKKLLKDDGDD